jgi:hypothetical protein
VNDVLYWIHHGRVPVIERVDGTTVGFTDGTERDYDTIVWTTGFRATLPFLDGSLVQRREGVAAAVLGAASCLRGSRNCTTSGPESSKVTTASAWGNLRHLN